MGNTPFKLKGWSPFTKTSPVKVDETDAEGNPIPHGKTEEEIPIDLAAERQKRDTLDKLIRKAESEGLSGDAAKKAAEAEYRRNL